MEQSTQRVGEAAQRASAVHDEMRAFKEGLRFDPAAFDRQQEGKHLERVKESRELHGTPISDEDAARIAHFEGLGEPILTNRERLVGASRGGVAKIEEAGLESASPVAGVLVGVHSVGHAGGGKTFIAVNLATAIAETTGRDTALVAFDDMSDVHDYFGLEAVRTSRICSRSVTIPITTASELSAIGWLSGSGRTRLGSIPPRNHLRLRLWQHSWLAFVTTSLSSCSTARATSRT